ncbi:MAG: hypothetical protein NT118_03110 [Lentisphaerae bacterium]|nr:hypothetical protein [Lentisphaerota bacterium]
MEKWVEITSALLTPVVGIATTTIAYLQWRTHRGIKKINMEIKEINKRNEEINKNRYKHELYGKRYDIYLSARKLIKEINITTPITNEMLDDYWFEYNKAQFLLNDDMLDFLYQIYIIN